MDMMGYATLHPSYGSLFFRARERIRRMGGDEPDRGR